MTQLAILLLPAILAYFGLIFLKPKRSTFILIGVVLVILGIWARIQMAREVPTEPEDWYIGVGSAGLIFAFDTVASVGIAQLIRRLLLAYAPKLATPIYIMIIIIAPLYFVFGFAA